MVSFLSLCFVREQRYGIAFIELMCLCCSSFVTGASICTFVLFSIK
jgi:hypothetical protein